MNNYEKQNFVSGQILKAEHLNHMEDGIGQLSEEIVEQGNAIEELSEEIANKGNPTNEQVGAAVNAYLDEHPVTPAEIDATLTQGGKAADAKAVGDKILYPISNNLIDFSKASVRGEWWYNGVRYEYSDGNDNTKCALSFRVPVEPNTKYYGSPYDIAKNDFLQNGTILYINIFDANGAFLQGGGSVNNFTTPATASYAMLTYKTYMSVDNEDVAYKPFLSTVDYAVVGYDDYAEFSAGYAVEAIKDLQERTPNLRAELKTPGQYELVVGDTFELFYKGIINAVNTDIFTVEITCAYGSPYNKRFIYTPKASHIGTIPMTVKLYDMYHNLNDTKVVNLIVKAKASSPATEKTVLYVGDSLAKNGCIPEEMHRRLCGNGGTPSADAMTNIAFIGTCESTGDGTKYEGYGGWVLNSYNIENKVQEIQWITAVHNKTNDDQHSVYADNNGIRWKLETIEEDRIKVICVSGNYSIPTAGTLAWISGGVNHENIAYTSAEMAAGNPFWDTSTGTVNFAKYVSDQGKSSLDYVYVLLGWNDAHMTHDKYKRCANIFIDNVLSDYPNCNVIFLGLQIPAKEGLAANYGANTGYYSDYFGLLQHVWKVNAVYEELANEHDNVFYVNVAGQFDTENNMMTASRTVNVRNSAVETYQANGVHPGVDGYMQIADAAYRDMVHRLQD